MGYGPLFPTLEFLLRSRPLLPPNSRQLYSLSYLIFCTKFFIVLLFRSKNLNVDNEVRFATRDKASGVGRPPRKMVPILTADTESENRLGWHCRRFDMAGRECPVDPVFPLEGSSLTNHSCPSVTL